MSREQTASCCRVAIVDDHPLMVNALVQQVASIPGSEVVFADSDLDGLLENWSQPQVVVLDVDLGEHMVTPGQVTRLRDLGARVLIVTVATDLRALGSLLLAGANGVVSKSETPEHILEALMAVGDGEDWDSALAMAAIASSESAPEFSPQEERVMVLYASGLKIPTVARKLDISPHTVKDYLRRIRAKFLKAGRPAPTQVHLYQEAVRLGLIDGA